MKTPFIRAATLQDARAIADFQLAMAWETENKRLDPDVVQKGVEAVFADPSRGFYLVGEWEDEVIGSLLVTREWSDWRHTDIWYIQSVYIQEAHRGQGCFRRMYDTVVQAATDQGVKVVRLYVETENQRAQAIYQQLGMKRLPYYMYQMEL